MMTFRNNAVRFTSETSNPHPRKRSAPSKTRTPFLSPLLLVGFGFQGRPSMGFETQDAKRRPAGDEILTPSENPGWMRVQPGVPGVARIPDASIANIRKSFRILRKIFRFTLLSDDKRSKIATDEPSAIMY